MVRYHFVENYSYDIQFFFVTEYSHSLCHFNGTKKCSSYGKKIQFISYIQFGSNLFLNYIGAGKPSENPHKTHGKSISSAHCWIWIYLKRKRCKPNVYKKNKISLIYWNKGCYQFDEEKKRVQCVGYTHISKRTEIPIKCVFDMWYMSVFYTMTYNTSRTR